MALSELLMESKMSNTLLRSDINHNYVVKYYSVDNNTELIILF